MSYPTLDELDELAYMLEEAKFQCEYLEETYGKPRRASYKDKLTRLLDDVEKDMEKAR